MNDRYYSNFFIAGFTYYDGIEVFEELKIGKELRAVPEFDNRHDPNAVALYLGDYKLGFIPRSCNVQLSKFFKLGYDQLFDFRINRVIPDEHPEKQIGVLVRINPGKSSY